MLQPVFDIILLNHIITLITVVFDFTVQSFKIVIWIDGFGILCYFL